MDQKQKNDNIKTGVIAGIMGGMFAVLKTNNRSKESILGVWGGLLLFGIIYFIVKKIKGKKPNEESPIEK